MENGFYKVKEQPNNFSRFVDLFLANKTKISFIE